MDIDSLVNEKIDADVDFQAELELMSDEDKAQALADKRAEVTKQEFAALDAKAKKDAELASNYKIRAEKAERDAKNVKPGAGVTPTNTPSTLTPKDYRALQDIHEDDVDTLMDYASFKKLSLAEAKKLPEMQAIFKTREEERKTAQAANSGGSRRPSSKVTGETLIERANSGQMPESDDDIRKFAEARIEAKKKR